MSPIQRLFTVGAVVSTVFAAPAPTELKRSPCEPLPHGHGLIPSPDSPEAFHNFRPFALAATSARTPVGYVQAYSNLLTTFDEPSQFVRYLNLDTYDVEKCAATCNSEEQCNAFAIFFERSPMFKPGPGCENPASSTLIKCTMWSGTILPNIAANKGQMRDQFSIVMAGSNAYVKDVAVGGDNRSLVVPENWITQRYENGAAISAPLDCHGVDTYMGMSYWRDGRLDAQRCIDACEAASRHDIQNRKCSFVNTYMQRRNGVPVSQHCAMFSQYWPALFATNKGQHRGPVEIEVSETDSYGIRRSDVEYTACYSLAATPSYMPLPSSTTQISPITLDSSSIITPPPSTPPSSSPSPSSSSAADATTTPSTSTPTPTPTPAPNAVPTPSPTPVPIGFVETVVLMYEPVTSTPAPTPTTTKTTARLLIDPFLPPKAYSFPPNMTPSSTRTTKAPLVTRHHEIWMPEGASYKPVVESVGV